MDIRMSGIQHSVNDGGQYESFLEVEQNGRWIKLSDDKSNAIKEIVREFLNQRSAIS